jgi:cytosine/adenosine deaminase-related metal-dependent hydrolase
MTVERAETIYRAAWVLPIDRPPIPHGAVHIKNGYVVAVGPADTIQGRTIIDVGDAVLLPGLVNAHTHLELSWMRGRVPPAQKFTDWVKTLFAIRGRPDGAMSAQQVVAIDDAIREAQDCGTAAVGDISNSMMSAKPMQQLGLDGVVFHELLGFKERDGGLLDATRAMRVAAAGARVDVSLAPHAPYSTSLELFKAIRSAVSESECPIMSVHLGESAEEVELIEKGSGPWRGMLEAIGAWRDDWQVPACDPLSYLDRHGVIDEKTLVVHGVQFSDHALARLAEIGATLVTCPRSNQWVGVGYPPIERFYKSGVKLAVGTDSLASVEDLNLFSELKTMRWLAPNVPAAKLLESATLVGARALGLDHSFGSLTPGKGAAVLEVKLPGTVEDVEEYLVSGIQPQQITWAY